MRKRPPTHRERMIEQGGCPWHAYSELTYLGWHDWSIRQAARGIRQRQCPDCKKWFWPEEFGAPS